MSDNDVVYYNLTIGNNSPQDAGVLDYDVVPTEINANNNLPILHNPDDYYGCIIRFSIPAINLPLITFLVQTNQADINLGVYSFVIVEDLQINPFTSDVSYNSISDQAFVSFIPQVLPTPSQIPTSPVGVIQEQKSYYLVYDYQHLIRLWNITLTTAHNQFIGQGVGVVPYFYYEPTSQLITFYLPKYYIDNNYSVGFNNLLLQYVVGLYTINLKQEGLNANGLDNFIVPQISNMTKIIIPNLESPPVDETFFRCSYQYNSYGYWNWLKTILITTNMNVNSEAVFNNNSAIAQFQNVSYANILEDFTPDLAIPNGAGIQNQIFTYFAQSLYRIFTFNQKNPLYKVNLAVSMVDTYGNTFPLPLPKGQQANFKLMFIKKSVYANMDKQLTQ